MSAVANAVPSASRSDPDRSIDELDAAICRLATRINAVSYQMLVLVREFDDRMGWAKWGHPSCAEWLSWRCGISLSAAREKVRTAHALRDLSEISLAFSEGRLSYTKVRALTRVAAMHDESALVRYALSATAPDVEERCRQIRNVHPDSVRDAQRAWEARWLSAYRNAARGTLCLRVELPLDVGELVMQAIEQALSREEIPDGVAERSPSGFHAQQADALVAVAKTYLDGGTAKSGADSSFTADRYQLVLHVDEAALHGGAGRSDAPLETVKRLACDASVVVVTEDESGTPLTVSRKQRTVSTSIRRAVVSRDRHCTFPGCHRTRFVEAHHVDHWVEGGETSVDNLTLLCDFHHRLLHEGGYRIRRDYRGERYFVRADGRAIPRCGYRPDDYTDDDIGKDPSMEGLHPARADLEHPSMEVRDTRGVYLLSRPQAVHSSHA
jgi:hypothetical protein